MNDKGLILFNKIKNDKNSITAQLYLGSNFEKLNLVQIILFGCHSKISAKYDLAFFLFTVADDGSIQ